MKHKHPKYWFWTMILYLHYVPYKLMSLTYKLIRQASFHMAANHGRLRARRSSYYSWNIQYRKDIENRRDKEKS